ncbi:MAG: carboxypeptidase-like regulatory domain-containing protein [Cytophagales bacterium]|nr:carboxypeptidase-like regulatory domain-containing protein [Cytophagales bacterium]
MKHTLHQVLPSGMGAGIKIKFYFRTGIFSVLLLTSTLAFAQEPVQNQPAAPKDYTIRGTAVLDEDNTPLVGVNIYLKGTSIGTYSDSNGRFEFPRKLKEGDVLIFSFVGLAKQEIVVSANLPQNLEIRMLEDFHNVTGSLWVDQPRNKTAAERKRKPVE